MKKTKAVKNPEIKASLVVAAKPEVKKPTVKLGMLTLEQKKTEAKNVKTFEQYKHMQCNPRWWSISHIDDIALLKKIVETEQTPIILAKAKMRIARLEKRLNKQNKVAAATNSFPDTDKPLLKSTKAKKK